MTHTSEFRIPCDSHTLSVVLNITVISGIIIPLSISPKHIDFCLSTSDILCLDINASCTMILRTTNLCARSIASPEFNCVDRFASSGTTELSVHVL
jgi:hypothetical protein